MVLVDTHCHLEAEDFPDIEAVLGRMAGAGVVHAVAIGQWRGPGDFGRAQALAQQHPRQLSCTLGLHPHEAAHMVEADWPEIERRCAQPEVRAVGETGLDYHYTRSDPSTQRAAFERQLALAVRLEKPVVLHVRDAHDDTLAMLKDAGVSRGVVHCFTAGPKEAEAYVALGLSLSISGIVTFPRAQSIQEAVRQIPLGRLLVETDSPYLAPVPHRGKPNEPAWVVHTARKVAELKGCTEEEVARQTTENAVALFGLPPEITTQ